MEILNFVMRELTHRDCVTNSGVLKLRVYVMETFQCCEPRYHVGFIIQIIDQVDRNAIR